MRSRLWLAVVGALLASHVGGEADAQKRARQPARVRKDKARARQVRSVNRPSAKAEVLRVRADKISRIVSKAKTSSAARRYVETRYRRDVVQLIRALSKLQRTREVPVVLEHRAMAAAARILVAAKRLNPSLVSGAQEDRVATMMSKPAYERRSARHETAVEIETRITGEIIASMTTPDGTIGPILKQGGKPAPAFLKPLADGEKVRTIRWDSLSIKQKHELLVSQSQGQSFSRDRGIPGVVFRKQIPNFKREALALGGKKYSKADKRVRTEGVLMSRVEHMGPTTVNNVSGVEFHVRQPGKAGRNARDAFTLVDTFSSKATQGHQHIPHRIPRAVMRGNALARTELVDFYRRANITAEIRSLLDGYKLSPVKDGPVTYFDFLKAGKLETLNRHFSSIATNGYGRLDQSEMKMAAVGFRTGELYKDKNMFGFEVRTLSRRDADRENFVNAVQKGVLTGHYGIPRRVMKAWHDKTVGNGDASSQLGRQSTGLGALHYNRPLSSLQKAMPKELESLVTEKVQTILDQHANENYGLKMVLHNWSRDPALSNDAAGRARVLKAQKSALKALHKGADHFAVARSFAQNSGLYGVFARSIGIRKSARK